MINFSTSIFLLILCVFIQFNQTTACEQDVTYGAKCALKCSDRHCLEDSNCTSPAGTCYGGCEEGFRGIDCITPCTEGENFGENCEYNCTERHCIGESDCSSTDGLCHKGCLPGYRGSGCAIVCVDGFFGKGCERQCHCANQTCDPITGMCSTPCEPPWKGPRCEEAPKCRRHKYGRICTKDCTKRQCNITAGQSTCARDGKCTHGCLPGYIPPDCLTPCANDTYGLNCVHDCKKRHCSGDSLCFYATGTCVAGCNIGYEGHTCMIKIPAIKKKSKSWIYIAAGVIGGLLLVAAIVYCIWEKRTELKEIVRQDTQSTVETTEEITKSSTKQSHKVEQSKTVKHRSKSSKSYNPQASSTNRGCTAQGLIMTKAQTKSICDSGTYKPRLKMFV